jgi:hypothetical protein
MSREMYQGLRRNGLAVVLADGEALDPAPSLAPRNHSPTGFAWGYGGSGPSQTALAILLDFTGDAAFAERHYQAFKREFIATADKDRFLIYGEQVAAFVREKRREG